MEKKNLKLEKKNLKPLKPSGNKSSRTPLYTLSRELPSDLKRLIDRHLMDLVVEIPLGPGGRIYGEKRRHIYEYGEGSPKFKIPLKDLPCDYDNISFDWDDEYTQYRVYCDYFRIWNEIPNFNREKMLETAKRLSRFKDNSSETFNLKKRDTSGFEYINMQRDLTFHHIKMEYDEAFGGIRIRYGVCKNIDIAYGMVKLSGECTIYSTRKFTFEENSSTVKIDCEVTTFDEHDAIIKCEGVNLNDSKIYGIEFVGLYHYETRHRIRFPPSMRKFDALCIAQLDHESLYTLETKKCENE